MLAKMFKILLYIYHGRLALMGIYAYLTARHLTYIYCIFFLCYIYCFKWQINLSLCLSLSGWYDDARATRLLMPAGLLLIALDHLYGLLPYCCCCCHLAPRAAETGATDQPSPCVESFVLVRVPLRPPPV